MAKVGLSKSYYALYSYDAAQGKATYSNGGILGKAVDANITINGADPVIFYADNGPAESAQQFGGGTLNITNDRLPLAPVAAILGLNVETVESPAGTALDFPADMSVPYVGYGTITKSIVGGITKWLAIILKKVQFMVPDDQATTQGETINFEGHGLTATVMRNDETPATWKKYGEFDSEADADTFVRDFLSITD